MTAISDPADDSLPAPAAARTVYAHPTQVTTIRMMHDPNSPAPNWLTSSPLLPRTQQNEALYYVNGPDTYKAMHEAILTATSNDHYIYIAGWFLSDGLPLKPGDPTSTIKELFKAADGKGVQIRALFWKNLVPSTLGGALGGALGTTPAKNKSEMDTINALPNDSAAILDNRTTIAGAHHQKILVVHGSAGLFGFCGGVDINTDRMPPPTGFLYDVHCRYRGPAAGDLVKVFVERWKDHPDRVALEKKPNRRPLLGDPPKLTFGVGRQQVQVVRTYGDGVYSFAKPGVYEIWNQLKEAIPRAKKFIYLENQYFVAEALGQLLAKAVPNVRHITCVIQSAPDLEGGYAYTKKLVETMEKAPGGADKVRVFAIPPSGASPPTKIEYVHSKTFIIDDEVAIVGSANGNRRGYTCDSECVAGIEDAGRSDRPSLRFAHRLRIRLWAYHLDLDTPTGHAELLDGVASVARWINLPAGAKVAPWKPMIATWI